MFYQNSQVVQQKGSALIITLLVITVVSAIVFSTGRLALGELKLTSQLEESDQAYYAAEAGIETGLLMFRFNHDVETTTGATKTEGDPIRFDLTDNNVSTISQTKTQTPNTEKQIFDLKEWYRADVNESGRSEVKVASTKNPDGSVTPALAENETVEYNVLKPDGKVPSDLTLEWEPANTRVEIIRIPRNRDALPEDKYLSDEKNDPKYFFAGMSSEINKIRIKAWGGELETYTLFTNDSGARLDSKTVTIESTGYFGGAKRKLQITVDRATGTLLGLHDFALFGSSNITVP